MIKLDLNYIHKCFLSVSLIVISFTSHSQEPGKNGLGILHPWEATCHQDRCVMDATILRGEQGAKADQDNPNEYIWMGMKLKRGDAPLQLITLSVDPKAQCNSGLFIAFTDTVRNGDALNMKMDNNGAIPIPFTRCDSKSRLAEIPFGIVKSDKGNIHLFDKFNMSSTAIILYVKEGRAYRTMVDLAGFKMKYSEVKSILNTPSK
jgi:hypothetical protein